MNENQTFDPETGELYEEPTTEMTLANAGTALVQSLGDTETVSISAFGFDAESMDGVKRIFNAQEDGESLNESGLEEILAVGIIVKPGVRVDPVSGSRTACANTIILSADGKSYVSQSNGIARTAAQLVALFTKRGGWPVEGVAVRVTESKLTGGRTYKRLVLA